jgi:hypothetical protein
MLGVGAQSQKTGHPTNHAAKFTAKMRHITCTGIYLCASKDYWLLDGGIAVINTEVLVTEQAAMEVAVVLSGIIPGEVVTPQEQSLYLEALRAARSHLPPGKIRWEQDG